MIHNCAEKIAADLINRKVVDDTSREVYAYGFELLISGIVNVLLAACISIAFRRYFDWFLFFAAFIPLRTTAGGYHASTHMMCIIVGTTTFAVLFAICRIQISWTSTILVISIMSFLLLIVFSPVEAHNKKLNEVQQTKNRKVSILIGIANLIIALITVFVDGLSVYLNIYFAGVFAAALSMLAVKTNILKGGN